MYSTKDQESIFNSTEIFIRLYQKRKLLLIIFLISIIGSIVFTSPYFITPLFKSSAIIYPVNTGSISATLFGDKQVKDNLSFGDETESEQLLQLLNSSLIRDHVVNKFNLLNHYQIDENEKFARTKLFKEFDGKFKFSRTEFLAVEIQVLDHDPKLAAEMANDIVKLIDTVKTNIQRQRAVEGLKIIADEYKRLNAEVKIMEDSLTGLRQKGVHEYESQVEMINQQLAIELGAGNMDAVKRLEKRLEILAEYGGSYVALRDALIFERQRLNLLKEKYQNAQIDVNKLLPQSFVVSQAYVAEKKSYPPRMIFVLSITISVMFFTILLVLFFDSFSNFRAKLIK